MTIMAEDIVTIVRAGGCYCEPPGSGEQFCTGHCLLRAAMRESLRLIHLSHPREPGCMPGCGPLHIALIDP